MMVEVYTVSIAICHDRCRDETRWDTFEFLASFQIYRYALGDFISTYFLPYFRTVPARTSDRNRKKGGVTSCQHAKHYS